MYNSAQFGHLQCSYILLAKAKFVSEIPITAVHVPIEMYMSDKVS